MEKKAFDQFHQQFKGAPIDDRIEMYCTTEGLLPEQYKVLLRNFTPIEIKKLEAALG